MLTNKKEEKNSMYDFITPGAPLFGGNITRKFCEVFPNLETFQAEWKELPFSSQGDVEDAAVELTYYLLVGRYSNSTIASTDEYQFEMRLFSILWQNAPLWQREIELQREVRKLKMDDIVSGTKSIYNHSYNPSTEPSSDSESILNTINDQNVSIQKRDKLKAVMDYESILSANPTDYYLSKFKELFISIVEPQYEALYETEE